MYRLVWDSEANIDVPDGWLTPKRVIQGYLTGKNMPNRWYTHGWYTIAIVGNNNDLSIAQVARELADCRYHFPVPTISRVEYRMTEPQIWERKIHALTCPGDEWRRIPPSCRSEMFSWMNGLALAEKGTIIPVITEYPDDEDDTMTLHIPEMRLEDSVVQQMINDIPGLQKTPFSMRDMYACLTTIDTSKDE